MLLNGSRVTKIACVFYLMAAWLHSSHTQILQLCKLWGEKKNVVTLSVCGLQTEHEDSLEMQAEKADAEGTKSLVMGS